MAIPQPKTVLIADGATTGYYEYGDPAGRPVLALHGVPACGAGFAWADGPARERQLRVLAPDRPGVGESSPRAGGWTVAEYVPMVAAFADALGLDRFGVWGYSGGGPYAVACAAGLGHRLSGVVVASGMGQLGEWATIDDFAKTDRRMLSLAARRPGAARRSLAVAALVARRAPKVAVRSFAGELGPTDRAVLDRLGPPADAMALFTEAFHHGAAGVVADYAAIGQRWDVDLASITSPVHIVHGAADTMVPVAHAERLHAAIAGSQLTVWPDEGHLAPVTHVGEILDHFIAS